MGVAPLSGRASASGRRWLVVGGAGFIGGHFVGRLLSDPEVERVTVFDNFTSGREEHLAGGLDDPRLAVVRGDVKELPRARRRRRPGTTSPSTSPRTRTSHARRPSPRIDFDEGTLLTHHVLEALRRASVGRILYASGSGVYGDIGEIEADEDRGPLIPISTYGASKLAGEALISAYCFMFGLDGPRVPLRERRRPAGRRTASDSTSCARCSPIRPGSSILGDGSQSKSYVYVDDVIDAMLVGERDRRALRRVQRRDRRLHHGHGDRAISPSRSVGLDPASVRYEYTGGDRGWKGDVPIVRLSIERMREPRVVADAHLAGGAPRVDGALVDAIRAGRL